VAIKSYSPEVIVIPVISAKSLDDRDIDEPEGEPHSEEVCATAAKIQARVTKLLSRIDALVVGPGLGRDPATLEATVAIIKQARNLELPLVLDGDALHLVAQQPDMISGYNKAVLTPNAQEFSVLCQSLSVPEDLQALCWSLGNVSVLQKGKADKASDGTVVITCDEPGSYRRCGGQGDTVAGVLGIFMFWAHKNAKEEGEAEGAFSPNLIAAAAASTLTRRASNIAFCVHGRALTAPDVICHMYQSVNEFFPSIAQPDPLSPSPRRSPSTARVD